MHTKNLRHAGALAATLATATMILTACGGGANANEPSQSGAAAPALEGRGPFTYVAGKDNSGTMQSMLDGWNETHPEEKVELVELSTEADQQRNSMINNAQTKSAAYCVLSMDSIWIPEFAARGWITELNPADFPKDKFLPAVWSTAEYRDKLFGVPFQADGGLIFYRADILKEAGITEAPTDWAGMISAWEKVKALPKYQDIAGYGGQFYKYEGFTVNIGEAINTEGGIFLDDAGKPAVDTPEAAKGVQRIVDGFKSGFNPEEALTYKEEEGRAAFEAGRILFYRNWPYQYSISAKALGADAVGVASLPQADGKPGASTLGGHDVSISSYCENKASALDFIKWFSDGAQQQRQLDDASMAPVWADLYKVQANVDKYPYLPALLGSIENAVPRPRAVAYNDTSAAIQDTLWPAIQGQVPVADALTSLNQKLAEVTVGN